MIADTENGVIFSLLPINVLTLSTSLYSMEHVKNFNKFNRWMTKTESLSALGWSRSDYFCFRCFLIGVFVDMAVDFLLFLYVGYWTSIGNWQYGLWLKLVQSTRWNAEIYDFDGCTIAGTHLFLWIWHDFVYIGSVRESM